MVRGTGNINSPTAFTGGGEQATYVQAMSASITAETRCIFRDSVCRIQLESLHLNIYSQDYSIVRVRIRINTFNTATFVGTKPMHADPYKSM